MRGAAWVGNRQNDSQKWADTKAKKDGQYVFAKLGKRRSQSKILHFFQQARLA